MAGPLMRVVRARHASDPCFGLSDDSVPDWLHGNMQPKKRNYPGYPHQGVSVIMSSMQYQYQGVPTTAAPFADWPEMLSSAPPPQRPAGTPWQHMNLEPAITQPPPMGHAGGEAISTATTELYPYPSSSPSHNTSLAPDFPIFSHGFGQPWSFNFQFVDNPLLFDQYPLFYQQDNMPLYDYDNNANHNPDNLVNLPDDSTASGHDHEGVLQSDAASSAQILNPPFSLPDPSATPSVDMASNLGLSMPFLELNQDESGWQFVEKGQAWSEDGQVSPGSHQSSGSASPIDGSWLCIPSYLDKPREVSSGYTTDGTSSPESLVLASHEVPTTRRRPRKRGALPPTERLQTSKTRRMAACIRCQMQKIRCIPNPDDEMGPCITCSTVTPSKKVIHQLHCCRWKLTAATVYRQAHLKLTKRWRGSTMYDIPASDWADDEIRIIQISEGLCSKPFEIKVRRFKPQPGDVTDRIWTDKQGNPHISRIPPYAIASVGETCKQFVKHAEENAFEAVKQFASRHDVHPIVQETYKAAWNHMRHITGTSGSINLKEFMKELWRFWFVLRHTMGSNEIVGDEHLGMEPEMHKDYPFPPGHLSVP
ncbi:Satratoxin biosynthesis SC3 cluster transcription factor SAT20 [Apiospora phragmitis]|uniref:Satratoxin biosynthesis SC3 cluster transcription factor SAT20 n=1 Tax=Apiospora phragmitis TaxID=2905665 RepID=A0ABR1WAU1_9PEZI